jgi:hypothetical protein
MLDSAGQCWKRLLTVFAPGCIVSLNSRVIWLIFSSKAGHMSTVDVPVAQEQNPSSAYLNIRSDHSIAIIASIPFVYFACRRYQHGGLNLPL